jgi:hypothetical protein
MSATAETGTAIRQCHVEIPDEGLEDPRRRIAFAAWEQPQLFGEELRAAFSPVRRKEIS